MMAMRNVVINVNADHAGTQQIIKDSEILCGRKAKLKLLMY